ncbi:alpha-amylase [Thelephora terrestris]|uniref:alpha-amylase n=1 Tax=Thelephora terrestris TaxID=56493 RepID=A0A9P6HRM8_9AGAM|nr:alpha-amylase [Thelephora terrestris]
MFFLPSLLISLAFIRATTAATAADWRSRSIYQLITDRYALPAGADPTACKTQDQTWCGGTWNTIRENLDYIQNAGFTAIWISPVNQNYQGPRTAYGDPYHGYWIQDASQLNSHFGTSDDLKNLSAEVHRRNMYLMVDVVVNNVMSTSINPDYSQYMFKNKSQYHTYCPVVWGDRQSEMNCWLGDTVVPLPDLNTQDAQVQAQYGDWIKNLVQEYSIDGLRIDAAKHVNSNFWGPFCSSAGVFCMGEVFGDDISLAAQYTAPGTLDSILNYPIYDALVEAFQIPGPTNTSGLALVHDAMKNGLSDVTVLGNFLENQDLPRWHNLSVDPQSLYNAMVFNFMSDGIPIVYYGQEQLFSGGTDPLNREPLWPSGYQNTTAYQIITTLNKFRNYMIRSSPDWLMSPSEVISTSPAGISLLKGNVVSVMTTIGSPPQNISMGVYTPFARGTALTDILSCTQLVIGSNQTVAVDYALGGHPSVLIPSQLMNGSGLCGYSANVSTNAQGKNVNHNGASAITPQYSSAFIAFFALLFGLVSLSL